MNNFKEKINTLLNKPVSWLSESGSDEDIAISSRIRLARNISGYRFPINSDINEKEHVRDIVLGSLDNVSLLKDHMEFPGSQLSKIDREFLFERHLISKEFCSGNPGSSLVVTPDEKLALMINEEDHCRIQGIQSGFSLRNIWESVNEVDSMLGLNIPFSFNRTLGYLTSCPTNVGTGMRASIMLNLPGLTLAGHISSIVYGAGKLGLAVRGLYGEGSECLGNLYQISNQSTLGESEEDIIYRLESVIRQLINHEKNSRHILLSSKKNFLLDYIGRAYGKLCYSYILTAREALNSLSALRMGVDLRMFSNLSIHTLNELFISIQDAHLQKRAGRDLNVSQRDIFRAEIVRNRLKA